MPLSQPTTVSAGIYGNVAVPAGVVPPVMATPREPDLSTRFSAWIKEDPLMKVGAFLFIIGCGWFVSYAFANNWIDAMGRIALGILAGVLVMAFGYWRMLKYPAQGAIFLALGAGMAILSVFAGRSIYNFFTPATAVLFDLLIAVFVSYASYKFNLRSLALSAQILAYVAPLLAVGQTNSFFLFSYLLAMSAGSLILAAVIGWRSLIVTSLVFVGMYSMPYIFGAHSGFGSIYANDAPFMLNFAYLFATLYLLSGMFAVVRKGVSDMQAEVALAALNGLFLFMWIYNVPAKEWQTLLFSAWAIVFAVGSFIAYRASDKLAPFYAYGSVAVAFIAAATAAQLSGTALTIAFTLEIAMLVAIILKLTRNVTTASTAMLLFIVPIALSLESMQDYLMASEVFTKDFFVLIILAFSLILAGRLVGNAARTSGEVEKNQLPVVAVVGGTVYLWFIVWSFMHILLPLAPDMATLITLVIYTIAGLAAYFNGLMNNDIARRFYGAALLVFVVVRLLLVDVWAMELSGRVITFFAIGILLMSTAFFSKKKSVEPTIVV
jgi:uncharacterized membrane protein